MVDAAARRPGRGLRGPREPARPDGRRDVRRLEELLTQPVKLLGERNQPKPVWHLSLSAAHEDPILSDGQWARIACRVMDRVGLAPEGDSDGVRWLAVRHARDHVHVVATLACIDGHRPDVWGDGPMVRDFCREVEDELGLRPSAPPDRTAARCPSRGEMEKARRLGWTEDPRAVLRRHIQQAAAVARTESEFFERLRGAGVLVRHRHSSRHPDQTVGYAAALPGYRKADGSEVWYGGGKLAADLTLPKLRARWPALVGPVSAGELDELTVRAYLRATLLNAAAHVEKPADYLARLRSVGVGVKQEGAGRELDLTTGYAVTIQGHLTLRRQYIWHPAEGLAAELSWENLRGTWNGVPSSATPRAAPSADEGYAILQDATRVAAFAADQIRHHIVAFARDACWATADLLRAVSLATRDRRLGWAADAYDRAARAPHGRIPEPTPAGQRLRGMARVLGTVWADVHPGTAWLSPLLSAAPRPRTAGQRGQVTSRLAIMPMSSCSALWQWKR